MPTQAGRQSSRCGSITAQQGRLADALHLTALLLPSFTVPLEAEAVSRHLALHPPPLLPLDAPALGSAGPGGGTQRWNCLDNTRSALGPLSPGAVRTNQLSPRAPGFIHPLIQPRASRGLGERASERETGAGGGGHSRDRQLPELSGVMRLSAAVNGESLHAAELRHHFRSFTASTGSDDNRGLSGL